MSRRDTSCFNKDKAANRTCSSPLAKAAGSSATTQDPKEGVGVRGRRNAKQRHCTLVRLHIMRERSEPMLKRWRSPPHPHTWGRRESGQVRVMAPRKRASTLLVAIASSQKGESNREDSPSPQRQQGHGHFDACSELGSNVNVVPPACASRRGVPLGWSINDILLRKTLYGHAQPPLVNGHRMSVRPAGRTPLYQGGAFSF